MRYCLEREFAKIYIYNLRGNGRLSGDAMQREGGLIFNQKTGGSLSPICIVFLIKKKDFHEKAEIFYGEVDDYLSHDEKIDLIIKNKTILNPNLNLQKITPNEHNDWLNQRDDSFNKFINIGNKKEKDNEEITIFKNYSAGVKTNRDAWTYNSSKEKLLQNMQRSIDFYNSEVERADIEKNNFKVNFDKTLMAWDLPQKNGVIKNIKSKNADINNIYISVYRPFFKQYLYFNRFWNNAIYQMPKIFPRENSENLCICVSGIGADDFSCLIINSITSVDFVNKTQCFPLHLYAEKTILNSTITFEKIDAITNEALEHFQEPFEETINKIDIFYYIYGLLHSKEYRTKYANNLMKLLPRLPRMKTFDVFNKFKIAGENLAHLHLHFDDFNNETIANYEKYLTIHKDAENYEVSKIEYAKFDKSEGKKGNAAKNKSKIIYNNNITIENIPAAVQEYIVNKKSALDWIVERCCVKQDKDSQIVNNFNDYCKEIGNPKYIYQLIINVIYISLESVKIINNLPSLEIYEKDL